MAAKAKKDDGLPWYAEDRDNWHPVVEAEVEWHLFARCVHRPSNIDTGELYLASDCLECCKERHMKLARDVRDMLAPQVALARRLQLP